MAYANSVGIMPGAASEKLPFVHSNFKPSSKFAKCFGGFKKFSRQYNNGSRSDRSNQTLPQIYYSGGDHRNLITWGSKARGGKPDYPGFIGKKTVGKKKDISTSTENSTSFPSPRHKPNGMKHYLSLPNLNNVYKSGGNGVMNSSHMTPDGKQRHPSNDTDDDRQMNGVRGHNLDSLIFFDDDSESQYTSPMVTGSSMNYNTSEFARSSPVANHPLPETDPFTKGIDDKLREARGKSGMKRDRRRDPDHMRMLGDIVTAQRMQELLLPRKQGEGLSFE